MTDAFRLAVGTLTALRVPPPRRIERPVAGHAMALAPLLGFGLGIAATAAALVTALITGGADGSPLLAAVAAVAAVALLTRGLHWDGLADTADALGSRKPAEAALEIMRQSDIGPFGVLTIVVVMLGQVAAVATAICLDRGALALVGGAVAARLAITWTCRSGVPAAREGGLGAAVHGSVSWPLLSAVTTAVIGLLCGTVWLAGGHDGTLLMTAVAALVVSIAFTQLFVRHCVRRLGGVTGDVMGAVCELAFLAFAVVSCIG